MILFMHIPNGPTCKDKLIGDCLFRVPKEFMEDQARGDWCNLKKKELVTRNELTYKCEECVRMGE
jgi:hypothetical protein